MAKKGLQETALDKLYLVTKGKKTYGVAVLGVLGAILGLYTGVLDEGTSSVIFLNALGVAGLRDALN